MEKYQEKAQEWVDENSSAYQISVKENDIVVTIPNEEATFTIACIPEGETKFNVWSDSPTVMPHLTPCIEFCESSHCTDIKQVLTKMNSILTEVRAGQGTKMADDDDDEEDEEDDGFDDYDDYYVQDDPPEETETERQEEEEEEVESFFGKGAGSAAAFQRLRKDLKNMKTEARKFGVEGDPRGDNLFIWIFGKMDKSLKPCSGRRVFNSLSNDNILDWSKLKAFADDKIKDVKLTGFPTDTRLGKDLLEFAQKYKRDPVVYLEMQFPQDYPMAPPFVRVIRPRFKFLTGHVTIGGSICMEMLTKSGWRPTNDIESILVQVRSEIMSDNNARLDSNPDRAYGEAEARDAFKRMVSRYGWDS